MITLLILHVITFITLVTYRMTTFKDVKWFNLSEGFYLTYFWTGAASFVGLAFICILYLP